MIEQLRHRAETIKDVLREQPARGADLLADFARNFAGNTRSEDEVILLKLNWMETTQESEREKILEKLLQIADAIAANYDPAALQRFLEKEQKLAQAAASVPRRDELVLVANNLLKNYPSSRFTLRAEHIELRLGEIAGLVGENATGKTTLFRILCGELAPDAGQVRYPLFDPKNRLHWPDLKEKIAYVPQELPSWRGSLRENLQYEAALHGLKGAENAPAVDFIIQRMGLGGHIEKSWVELSGGYKLRFALAKALVWRSQLLIVDEPLAFLDIKTQLMVLQDLKNLAKSLRHPMAIVVSSQHLHEVEAVADQLWFMREGQLENLGRTADFGEKRRQNVFELGCSLPFAEFCKALEGFEHHKTWSNGLHYFVTAPLGSTGFGLLQFLAQKQVSVTYYRDISRSVKTKFYADNL